MRIQIDDSNCDDSKTDTQVEIYSYGDSIDIAVRYDWDNYETTYKEVETVHLKNEELKNFFNAIKAIEATMVAGGTI